jgi:hypothetical protein
MTTVKEMIAEHEEIMKNADRVKNLITSQVHVNLVFLRKLLEEYEGLYNRWSNRKILYALKYGIPTWDQLYGFILEETYTDDVPEKTEFSDVVKFIDITLPSGEFEFAARDFMSKIIHSTEVMKKEEKERKILRLQKELADLNSSVV